MNTQFIKYLIVLYVGFMVLEVKLILLVEVSAPKLAIILPARLQFTNMD